MCAGLRGYGSWAAAEYLKRHWRQLYKDFKNDDLQSAFGSRISITN